MTNPHDGHRKRVAEEFLKKGMDHFPDHEKLEMLLFFSISRGDTNVLGHELMERFGSFSGVLDAPYELLKEVSGVGHKSALLIKTVSGFIKAYMDDYASTINTIKTTVEAKEYMRYKFLCENKEQVIMACIGGNGKVVYCDVIVEGTPETVAFKPQDFIRRAIISDAVKVVIAHNHPNGFCNPSSKDVYTTNILGSEFQRVGVELFDHVISAPDGVCSMRELGMIGERK